MFRTYLDLALLLFPILAVLFSRHPKLRASNTMAYSSSSLQYWFACFVCLLGVRYASSYYSILQLPIHVSAAATCTTLDQPNPIAHLYPNNATGTLNGTIAVLPIPLPLARQLIPAQYRILEHAYRSLLPDFPRGMYPAIVQAVHDHDIQAGGFNVDDFSVGRWTQVITILF